MIVAKPCVLEGYGVRLEPLSPSHAADLTAAASDGRLWELWFTSVPAPDGVERYIATAIEKQAAGVMLPWVVRELRGGGVVGSTRYHDIVAEIDRVEIGFTWYAARWQRSHVNTACKILLLRHAFDVLGCAVVGFRTDQANERSQRAIEALGAQRDGVLRHHQVRPNGSARNTVFYSILAGEWPPIEERLLQRLQRHGGTAPHDAPSSEDPTEPPHRRESA